MTCLIYLGMCLIHVPDYLPSEITFYPLHVTSYSVWDSEGNIMSGYGGQCDSDCRYTATMFRLPDRVKDYAGGVAACITDWIGKAVYVPGYGTYRCLDTFGLKSYRVPFFHDGRGLDVVPIDLLTRPDQPIHDLVYNWRLLDSH